MTNGSPACLSKVRRALRVAGAFGLGLGALASACSQASATSDGDGLDAGDADNTTSMDGLSRFDGSGSGNVGRSSGSADGSGSTSSGVGSGGVSGSSSGGGSGSSSGGTPSSGSSSGASSGASAGSGSSGGSSGASSSSGSASGSDGGSSGAPTCTAPTTGTAGWGSRFWDCCKPSCSWPGNVHNGGPAYSCNGDGSSHADPNAQSVCSGGGSTACYSFAPWSSSSTLSYGFVAFNGGSCGDCYQLTFTGKSQNAGSDPGSASLCGKQMVVQVVNIGGIAQNQFDIMIPGGGVGANVGSCNPPQNGAQNGGFLTTCEQQSSDYPTRKSCVQKMCAALPSGLQAGCNWFVDWYGAADNPAFMYQKLASCPSALTSASGLQ